MGLKLGIRGKLFLVSFAIILFVGLVSGIYLQNRLIDWYETRLVENLTGEARAVAEFLSTEPHDNDPVVIDDLADRLGSSLDIRITVISEDGVVLGDSEITPEQLAETENHSDRPEFTEAVGTGFGLSRRYSTTLRDELIYVAVPIGDGSDGVVRIARPLSEVGHAVKRLQGILLVAGLVGLVIAGIISILASYYMSGTLKKLINFAKDVSEGKYEPGQDVIQQPEFAGLAGSITRLAEDLEKTMGELATERDHLNAVLKGMEDGVVAVNDMQVITLINPAAMELLELKHTVVGQKIFDVIRIPVLVDLIAGDDEQGPTTIEFDYPGLIVYRILATVAPFSAKAGRVIVMRDVTEVKRLEQSRREFFANASHELRTPVGIIRANTETLLEGAMNEPESAENFIDGINRNSLRLTNLLNDLLQISKIEAGKFRIEPKPVDPGEITARILETMDHMVAKKRTAIRNDIPTDTRVLADEKALEEVLVNLIDNAIKYTQDNGSIVVDSVREGNKTHIRVIDDGPGIPPIHRDRIFERFYRIDPGRSSDMGGTGLGLAIVKHLMSAMGGTVSYHPAQPHGSMFTITLDSA